jgi:hydroxymethylglutaryl-CoA lyase
MVAEATLSICEVGPRDGLQNQSRHYDAKARAWLVSDLAAAGLKHIEAVSFANPKLVPQMAEPERVLDLIKAGDDVRLAGLAMNLRGVTQALATRLHEVRYVVVASETFSRRNQNATIAETVARFGEATSAVRSAGKTMTVVVAASFGCPFEGEVPAGRVAELVGQLIEFNPDEIVLADTIGVGVPRQVEELAGLIRPLVGSRRFGFHFHNTRNTGYATPGRRFRPAQRCWTVRSAASAAVPSRRARPATSRRKTLPICWSEAGLPPASTSTGLWRSLPVCAWTCRVPSPRRSARRGGFRPPS